MPAISIQPMTGLPHRRESLRLSVVAAVAVSLAIVAVLFAFAVVTPLVTAWWLGSQQATVSWEIDKTNWRQGGATSVSFGSIQPFFSAPVNDNLKYLHKLHRVISLSLSENEAITDDALVALRGLDWLRDLNLEHMDRFRAKPVHLHGVPLSDLCLVHLAALPRLETLTLAGNAITDQGLAQIARMSNLKGVDLEATEVTDAGLVYLEGMKNLETVNLGATRVSKEGLTRLQMARPDLTIELENDQDVKRKVQEFRGGKP